MLPIYFLQIAFQLTELFQIQIDAVIILLAALFISVSNRYQKKTIYLLFATG